MAFDKATYDREYKKKHNKQFKAVLKPEELEELNILLKKNDLNKSKFIRMSTTILKENKDLFFASSKVEK